MAYAILKTYIDHVENDAQDSDIHPILYATKKAAQAECHRLCQKAFDEYRDMCSCGRAPTMRAPIENFQKGMQFSVDCGEDATYVAGITQVKF
jgi:hypothetical protein